MIFTNVLLPAPFSPSRAWTSPERRSKSTPFSASIPPKRLRIPRMRSNVRPAAGVAGADSAMPDS
jgi:hypothetical protein